ncbi:unnamed protein product [Closterium sp. Naga37s-1]|nr:unnamed protein product [Closterium sp. Naga37s-1]
MATEATREAFVELQGRLVETDSKLKQAQWRRYQCCSLSSLVISLLAQVLGQEKACEVDVFTARTTLDELQELSAETNVYQSIVPCPYPRLAFMLASLQGTASSRRPCTRMYHAIQKAARATEEGKIKEAEATIASLQGSKKYLEKQMREVQSNFKELMEQLPASIPGLTQAING